MEAETISLFRLKVNRIPQWGQFILCLMGILVFNSVSTLLNATLCNNFRINGLFFIPFLGFAMTAFLSFHHLVKFLSREYNQMTTLYLMATGLLTAIAKVLTYFAVLQIKRSQVALYESTNIIAILAVNAFLIRKKYSYAQVISICVIAVGFYQISISGFDGRNKYSPYAMIALVISSSMDAIVINMEEQFHKTVHFYEVKSVVVSTAAVVTGVLALLDDETLEIARKCSTNYILIILLVLFALTSYIGLSFIFVSIKLYGAVITTMFTGLQIAEISTFHIRLHKQLSSSVLVSHILIFCGMFVFIFRPAIDKKTNQLQIHTEEILQIFEDFPNVNDFDDQENVENAV